MLGLLPSRSAYTVALIVTPQSIGGDGQIAYVWGTDEVAWTTAQNGKTTSSSHKGVFLNVLVKQANGEFLTYCVTKQKIQTDPPPRARQN